MRLILRRQWVRDMGWDMVRLNGVSWSNFQPDSFTWAQTVGSGHLWFLQLCKQLDIGGNIGRNKIKHESSSLSSVRSCRQPFQWAQDCCQQTDWSHCFHAVRAVSNAFFRPFCLWRDSSQPGCSLQRHHPFLRPNKPVLADAFGRAQLGTLEEGMPNSIS